MPKPSVGGTQSASAGPRSSPKPSSASRVSHPSHAPRSGSGGGAARKRGRWRAVRGLDRSFGSSAVTMLTPSGRESASGRPRPVPRRKKARAGSTSTMLNGLHSAAGRAAMAAAAAAAVPWSSAMSGSSPRERLPGARPRLPGRFSTVATTPAPFAAIQVPPASRSRPPTASGRSGHQAAGGSQPRESISSRFAPMKTGQDGSGRRRMTTVHMGRASRGWPPPASAPADAGFRGGQSRGRRRRPPRLGSGRPQGRRRRDRHRIQRPTPGPGGMP